MLTVTQVKREPGFLPRIWLALRFSLSVPYNLLEIRSLEREKGKKFPLSLSGDGGGGRTSFSAL